MLVVNSRVINLLLIMSTTTKNPNKACEIKSLKGIGQLLFFKEFVLLNIIEGAHLGLQEIQDIQIVVSSYFKNSSFGYVCNRETSYSVDPVAYTVLNRVPNLKCIAVLKKFSGSHDIEVERHFIKKPFEVFPSLDEATAWLNTLV